MSENGTKLPTTKQPYLLRDREGTHYLISTQLVTVIASAESSGGLFELVSIAGCQGDSFPAHLHARAHEGIYVQDGLVEVTLGNKRYLLAPGDYAHIPAGTIHAYRMHSHHARFLSLTSKGEVGKVYAHVGTATDLPVHPPQGVAVDLAAQLAEPIAGADFELADAPPVGEAQLVTNITVPDGVVPYVIASGGGIQRVVGRELYILLATNTNTNGEFLVLDNIGPAGNAIIQHLHEKHTETFLCTAGQMTMWGSGEQHEMHPGDFLHVPAGTVHSFRMDAHCTRFFSVLAPGIFEPFFFTLGSPYNQGFIFPVEPGPARFDRLMQKVQAGELDLKVVGPPPDGSGGPGGPPSAH